MTAVPLASGYRSAWTSKPALGVLEPGPVADLHVLHHDVGGGVLHVVGQHVRRRPVVEAEEGVGRLVPLPGDVGRAREVDVHTRDRRPPGWGVGRVGEDRLGWGVHGGMRAVDDGARGVVGVRRDVSRRVDHQRVAVTDVDIDDGRGVDVGDHRVDAADVGQQRVAELPEDADVDVAGRADRADQRRVLALEHGGEAGDAALDGLLEDDVGLVEARLGPAGRVVVDLHRHGGPLGNAAARRRFPGERAGGRRCRRRRGGRLHLGGRVLVRGGGRTGAEQQPGQSGGRQHAPGERTPRPGCGNRRKSPSLGVDRTGVGPASGVIPRGEHAAAPPSREAVRRTRCRLRCPRARRHRCRPRSSCHRNCRRRSPVPTRNGRTRSPWRGG